MRLCKLALEVCNSLDLKPKLLASNSSISAPTVLVERHQLVHAVDSQLHSHQVASGTLSHLRVQLIDIVVPGNAFILNEVFEHDIVYRICYYHRNYILQLRLQR